MNQKIKNIIISSIAVKNQILQNDLQIDVISKMAEACTIALKAGNKLMFCGNGGSAADAQHLAAEFSGRFYMDRKPLPAEALHVNTSYLTAVANDYSFEEVYARLVEGSGKPGDILFGISTSGNSVNIVKALQQSKKMGMVTLGFTGAKGGKMAGLCDLLLNVPSIDTPRIQESHIMCGHIICEIVENNIFPI